ncbi:O-antigen translocase [Endothiovibrio diazotrophicus]
MALQLTLKRTFLLTSATTTLKIGAALLINKVVALELGPSGLAALGQMQNAIAIAMTSGSGGLSNGVTKLLAERHDDEADTARVLQAALRVLAVASLLGAALTLVWSRPLSAHLFGSVDYAGHLVALAAALPLLSYGMTFRAAINGRALVGVLSGLNALQTISVAGMIIAGAWLHGLAGALAGLIIGHTLSVAVTALPPLRRLLPLTLPFRAEMGRHLRPLFQFSAMTLVGALLVPLIQIVMRGIITDRLSADAAGIWEAVLRISDTYLMFVTIPLGIYFLPKFASATGAEPTRREFHKGLRFVLATVPALGLLIYLNIHWVVPLLFSPKFAAIGEIIAPQLVGDVLKMLIWVCGYLMLAHSMVLWVILGDVIFSALFVAAGAALIDRFGLIGACYAYVATSTLHLAAVLPILYRHIRRLR